MTKLRERLALPAYGRAWEYLNRAICQISDEQEPEVVRLKVPLMGAGGPALEKDVSVRYFARPSDGKDAPWKLRWEPVGGGPYPEFEGLLTIDPPAGEAGCALVIEGVYAPPLGKAGKAFDSVVGSKIASMTAREFLRSIADQMELERSRESG